MKHELIWYRIWYLHHMALFLFLWNTMLQYDYYQMLRHFSAPTRQKVRQGKKFRTYIFSSSRSRHFLNSKTSSNKIIAYIGHFKVKCFYFLLVINLHTLLIKALGLQNRTLKYIIYHSLSLPYKWTWLQFPYIIIISVRVN